ncbi:MAG: YbaK/EbsC family protein [Planctomycetota bacterium]
MSRLSRQLAESQVEYKELWHAPAFSAQRRARFLGESGHRVVKALLMLTEQEPVLVLVPASCDVEPEALKRLLGVQQVRLASNQEIVRSFPDCAYGTVPGFGRPYRMATVVDRRLLDEPYLVLPGTGWYTDYRVRTDLFQRMEQPISGDIARPLPRFSPRTSRLPRTARVRGT